MSPRDMHFNIVEIISRSEQGVTRPFLCRAENDALYYVKGRYAGYRALCCEWVAGRLGKLMRLALGARMCSMARSRAGRMSSRLR